MELILFPHSQHCYRGCRHCNHAYMYNSLFLSPQHKRLTWMTGRGISLSFSTPLLCPCQWQRVSCQIIERRSPLHVITWLFGCSASLTVPIADGSCHSVDVSADAVTLHRKRNHVTTYQRRYRTTCGHVPPTPLVRRVLAEARAEPVLLANLSDPASKALVQELSGSLVLLVDVEAPIAWSRLVSTIERYKTVLLACDSRCALKILRQVREERGVEMMDRWYAVTVTWGVFIRFRGTPHTA